MSVDAKSQQLLNLHFKIQNMTKIVTYIQNIISNMQNMTKIDAYIQNAHLHPISIAYQPFTSQNVMQNNMRKPRLSSSFVNVHIHLDLQTLPIV